MPRSTARAIVALLRPREWSKNVFVLAPVVFSSGFVVHDAVIASVGAFVLFSLAASAVYVLNDLHDRDEDRAHPRKSITRPLASGALSARAAIIVLLGLYLLIACGCVWLPRAAPIVLAYIGLNIAHTYILKAEPVIDIFSIAFGFVLRVYAGARVIEVPVSAWMFVTTLCLALYLATVKRRQEMNWVNGTGRRVLAQYTTALLDRFAILAATGALIFYSLFVMASRPALVATIPLVLFGLFRYAWLVDVRGVGESPAESLFTDWQLAATVVSWAGLCAWVLLRGAQ